MDITERNWKDGLFPHLDAHFTHRQDTVFSLTYSFQHENV
jgi:hypothetical protein